jgi:hypothetical protein
VIIAGCALVLNLLPLRTQAPDAVEP